MKFMIRIVQLTLLYLVCVVVSPNHAKFVGNVKDGDDGGTITILDIQDDNKTQYLNQNFEQGNYNYGYDIKPSGPVGQFHHENKAPDNVVYGCYGYEAPDLKNHMTFYISDSWGYRPVRQEMDTEIFFPADNPGGGHQKGTMTRWADLFFPEMCAHFAERIASSTNVVTKAPIQVATPPVSFSATKFEVTSQPNAGQPLTGPPSPLSTSFGSKNTPVPSGSFDVVHLNTPTTSGPAASSPFGRLTSTNPGTRQPATGSSNNFNLNLPTEQQQPNNFNNIIPNRFSTPGGQTRPSSTTSGISTGGSRPIGTNTAGLRTTAVPSVSEAQGSNVGSLLPNNGATSGNRTPQANTASTRPSPVTGQNREPSNNGQTSNGPSSRPTPSSSRPGSAVGNNNNNNNVGQLNEPFSGTAVTFENTQLPVTATSRPINNGPATGTSRLPFNQPASPTGSSQFSNNGPLTNGNSGQPSTNGLNFGDREPTTSNGPQGHGNIGQSTPTFGQSTSTFGQSTPTFGQTGPSGRPTSGGRTPSNGSPGATSTTRFRSTTVGPIPVTSDNGNSPLQGFGPTGSSRTPSSSIGQGEGSNSGLISPSPHGTDGGSNLNEGPAGTTHLSNTRLTQAPFRFTAGTHIGNGRVTANPYNLPDGDNDNDVQTTTGNRAPSPTGAGSRRPTGTSNVGGPVTGTTSGSSNTAGLPTGSGASRNPTGRPVTANTPSNSRTPTGFSSPLTENQGSTQGFPPASQSSTVQSLTGPSSPFTSQGTNPPEPLDNNRGTTGRRPTSVPSSSRFPTAGFSGNVNNPSTLQPSSTNQQTNPPGNSPSRTTTNGQFESSRLTSNAPTPTGQGQRTISRFSTPLPSDEQTPLIPQEPDFDNGLPHISTQPAGTFATGIGSNSPGRGSSNPATSTLSIDNEGEVPNGPSSGRPSTNPTFGARTTTTAFTPTRSPTFSPPRGPTPNGNGTPPRPQTGPGLRNDSHTGTQPNGDNDFCASQCSSCNNPQQEHAPPSPPRDEDFLNIPGAVMSQVPVIFYPDCSANAYMRPAIVPFCPSSQPSSQCNNGRQQPLKFADASNFIIGHQDARNAFASAKKEGGPRVARKVRRGGHHQRRILT